MDINAHILVFIIIFQKEELELLGEMSDSRTGAGTIQDEPGASPIVRK